MCRCCANCGLFLLTATVKQCCWVLGFQCQIWAAVYCVHVESAFLIWALPTVRPVSNLALQRFLSLGQRPLFHQVSISSIVNSSRCAGCGIAPSQPHLALFHSSLFFFFFFPPLLFFYLVFHFALQSLTRPHPPLSLTPTISLSHRRLSPRHANAASFNTKVRS